MEFAPTLIRKKGWKGDSHEFVKNVELVVEERVYTNENRKATAHRMIGIN